jgi:hypothetical protein
VLLAEGITAEYDARGERVGLEILDDGKRFSDPSTPRQIILEGIGPAFPLASTQP